MKKAPFEGVATALITPFKKDGSIDFDGLGILIENQIENDVSAIVIAGTTGEASTLSFAEFSFLISKANEYISHRIPLIVGTGSNNTAKALNIKDYGIAVGNRADLILLDTQRKADVLIDIPERLVVIKNGRITVEVKKEVTIHR